MCARCKREDQGPRSRGTVGIDAVQRGRRAGSAGEPRGTRMVAELTAAGRRENGAGQRLVLVEVGEDLGDRLRDRLGRDTIGDVPDALVVPLRQPIEERLARAGATGLRGMVPAISAVAAAAAPDDTLP